MNNVYREAFVFDCAEQGRPFYLPKEGDMPLHFFDVEDLCRFMEILITQKPKEQIYNVGNQQTVTIREWVTLCYEVVGKTPNFVSVSENVSQRSYFPFLNYAYKLDVSKQKALMPHTKNMRQGLMEAYEWYKVNREAVRRKPLIEFIDTNL